MFSRSEQRATDGSTKEHKRNRARLIQILCESDPLCCPAYPGKMKVIRVIERRDVIKKILRHLGFWNRNTRLPPETGLLETAMDTSDSQLPSLQRLLYRDPEDPNRGLCFIIFRKLWQFDAPLCPDEPRNSLFLNVFEDLNPHPRLSDRHLRTVVA